MMRQRSCVDEHVLGVAVGIGRAGEIGGFAVECDVVAIGGDREREALTVPAVGDVGRGVRHRVVATTVFVSCSASISLVP